MQSWEARVAVCAIGSQHPREHSDEALVFLLRNAIDQTTFDDLFQELFRRYHLRVTAWCCRMTRNSERALDLAQEIFLLAFRRLDSFRGDARFGTWLYAITRNHCLNALKKWRAEPVEKGETLPFDLRGSHGMEVHSAMERSQSFENMWKLIEARLSPVEARIMTLHYGYDMPLAAITRQLMLSNRSGAKAYIVSARRKLSALLRGDETKSPARPIPKLAMGAGAGH
jgi:RNA polymerase sigma-70 factor (ECF subfamily)